jgi:predicted DNA-binding mobile mystery protein A
MKEKYKILIINQLDKKIRSFRLLKKIPIPTNGWINLIRKTLNMSLRQLGARLQITPQGVRDIERREMEGAITLNTLKEAGDALDMQLVYGFIPKDDSLEKMIERKAYEMASKIVNRTSTTMQLEDQGNSIKRIKQAIVEMTEELKREIPKSLWD